jgi:hypothetical protein
MNKRKPKPDRQHLTNRERKRPRVLVTLHPKALARLNALAEECGCSRGKVLDHLLGLPFQEINVP